MNRATACTNLNDHSSRSHALLIVTVAGFNSSTGHRTTGTPICTDTHRCVSQQTHRGIMYPHIPLIAYLGLALSISTFPCFTFTLKLFSFVMCAASREAEPGRPGGLGADHQVRRRGQPSARGSVHQQVPVGPGRRHQCAALSPVPRALPQLPPHVPAAGLTERRQQDPHDGAGQPDHTRPLVVQARIV